MPSHMEPHPTVAGIVWDSNANFYRPAPQPSWVTGAATLAQWEATPEGRAVILASKAYGTTMSEQETSRATLAAAAGVPYPFPASISEPVVETEEEPVGDLVAQGLSAAATVDPEPISRALLSFASGIKSLLGGQHQYADVLTHPNTGAQWKLQYEILPAIIDNYTTVKEQAGTITRADYDLAIDALTQARDQFFDYLNKSGLIQKDAGKHAMSDFQALFNGGDAFGQHLPGLIPDAKRKRDALPGGFASTLEEGASGLFEELTKAGKGALEFLTGGGGTATSPASTPTSNGGLTKVAIGPTGSSQAATARYMPLVVVLVVLGVLYLVFRR